MTTDPTDFPIDPIGARYIERKASLAVTFGRPPDLDAKGSVGRKTLRSPLPMGGLLQRIAGQCRRISIQGNFGVIHQRNLQSGRRVQAIHIGKKAGRFVKPEGLGEASGLARMFGPMGLVCPRIRIG